MEIFSDEYFMKRALVEAQEAFDQKETPVGAIVVSQNKIIAKAHNQVELLSDVTAHAEVLAITAAANYLGAKYLKDCTLYVTLEPCLMCAGALYWSQIGKVVFGASDKERGFEQKAPLALHPKTELVKGVMEKECQAIIKDFFSSLR